jgi:hypothetical protein
MRVQQVENAMFDLARSEAGYPEDSINSLSNNNEDLTQAVQNTSPLKLQFNADDFTEKMDILDEIKQQDFDDISDWNYLESTMPNVSDCIIQKCTDENISLYDFISQEVECSNKNLVKVVIVGVEDADEEIKETKPV